MLHLEVDLPGADGIDQLGLRSEWNAFYSRNEGAPQATALRHRVAAPGRAGALSSLPSNAVLTTGRVAAARAATMHVAIASGPPALRLNAFLRREREPGRGFDERRWHRFNDGVVAAYSSPEYTPLLLPTFNQDGDEPLGCRSYLVSASRSPSNHHI
jgi:hypothetical protein